MYYFWKAIYAIRYWRVFLMRRPEKEDSPSPAASATAGAKLLIAIFLLAFIGMAVGSGFVFWNINKQLNAQALVDVVGQPVDAKITALEVKRQKNRSSGPDKTAVADTENCFATFEYNAPGSKANIRKHMRLTYLTLCKRYKAGQTTRARVVPGDTRYFVLEDDRIAPYWWWISLAMFVFFSIIAIFFVRSVFGLRASARKSET